MFKNKRSLSTHERSCLKISKGESFLKYDVVKPYDKDDKILPLSQPMSPLSSQKEPDYNNHQSLKQPQVIKTVNSSTSSKRQNSQIKNMKIIPTKVVAIKDDSSSRNEMHNASECKICKLNIRRNAHALSCVKCDGNYHQKCMKMTPKDYQNWTETANEWCCKSCLGIEVEASNLKWGDMSGFQEITDNIMNTYSEITKWKKNMFEIPKGNIGKELVSEVTKIIQLFTSKTKWEPVALHMLNIFLPLMLQKPSSKSKNRDHIRYLRKRIDLWKQGKLLELVSECKEIQKRLINGKHMKDKSNIKGFTNLMLQGKVKQAVKLINADSDVTGIHELTHGVRQALEEKHPDAEDIDESLIVEGDIVRVEEVIFEEINQEMIQKAAQSTFGTGGPTQIDADIWKVMICAKRFGRCADELADQIAILARRMCTEKISNKVLQTFLACRLVPLMKEDNGIRPVGIGESLRRIVGKCVSWVLKKDIIKASGTLQTCTGIESGIEAAIHAMKSSYKEKWCEVVMLVDADNAFNRLNRKLALENIQKLCPPIHLYLENSYNTPTRLYLNDGTFILSKEGATQGDNLAMAKYALATTPMINFLEKETKSDQIVQVWFADDSTCGGTIEGVKKWWDHLKGIGPKYGYYPKPSKTYIVVKKEEDVERVKEIFGDDEIKITTKGHRHIGAALGSDDFKKEFVEKKIENWINDVKELSDIAEEEPQAAFSAFNTSIAHRWTFLQRTVENISEYFIPLENVIREKLIPALIGRQVSDDERKLISLPYRYGGLGIQNPVEMADREYCTSEKITEQLTKLIMEQDNDITKFSSERSNEVKRRLKSEKEMWFKALEESLKTKMNDTERRYLETAQEKGASSWLSALPIKRLGYDLNKQDFRDAVSLRYGWKIKGVPNICSCGKQNDIDHALICHKGGFVNMRHDKVRNVEAKLMQKVCKDVQVEPILMPTRAERLNEGTNIAPNARLDIAARGVWTEQEKTFFDVRITHPNAPSLRNKKVEQVYKMAEKEKKNTYNDRILNVEKSSFTPLIFSTSGGMGPECQKFNKRLAELTAAKTNESYSHVISHMRTALRFALLKSTVAGLRGFRGKKENDTSEEEEIDYNLIPNIICYESK